MLRANVDGACRPIPWAAHRDIWVLIAGLLLGAVIPFTLLVILPTNTRLLAADLDRRSAEAAALLARWGRLTRSAAR